MAASILKPADNDRHILPMYHWTPPPGYKNFGDEISPMLVEAMLKIRGLRTIDVEYAQNNEPKLLAVGSVIQHARKGDIVWGAGVNGKSWPRLLETNSDITFCSVRGPISRETVKSFGHECPEIYGDPGIMFPLLFRDQIAAERAKLANEPDGAVMFIPNLNDDRFLDRRRMTVPDHVKYVSPSIHPFEMAARISKAGLVLSSSLHGIVFAETMGIPCRLIASAFEPMLKYVDYFEGTNRSLPNVYNDAKSALDGKGHAALNFDITPVMTAFPKALLMSGISDFSFSELSEYTVDE